MNLKDLVELDLVRVKKDILKKVEMKIGSSLPDEVRTYIDADYLGFSFGKTGESNYRWASLTVIMDTEYDDEGYNEKNVIIFDFEYPVLRLGKQKYVRERVNSVAEILEIVENVNKIGLDKQ